MHRDPIEEKIAEFVRNFGRQPTSFELQHACCDDCYQRVLHMEKARTN